MKLNRRSFIKATGIVGLGASNIWSQSETGRDSQSKNTADIRVAQIKVYPQKGKMEENHQKLMEILKDIEENENVDVVVTPEGFLDG